MRPGTSALFLILETGTPERAVRSLSRFGGTVLESTLSAAAEAELQDALHGSAGGSAT